MMDHQQVQFSQDLYIHVDLSLIDLNTRFNPSDPHIDHIYFNLPDSNIQFILICLMQI